MAGRPIGSGAGVTFTESHRDKIRNSKILNRLIRHAEGVEDMKQTEVNAALGLLKKALPDLSSVTLEGGDENNPIRIAGEIILRGIRAKG